mgnify:CR=1 FL=1
MRLAGRGFTLIMASSEADVNRQRDDSHVTAQQWRWTVLAGMASYIDAGSIVALAAGLATVPAPAVESDGARQSLRGLRLPPASTFGPLGIALRLNWLGTKKR